jgi:UDP-glucose:(heptosyl)LPS alpha-1,3-glucosyltransferase
MLSRDNLRSYREAWSTPDHRLHLLPDRIAADRARPELRDPRDRLARRAALGYSAEDVVWLWVAVQPATKGLDRVLTALPSHPDARLLVVGPAPESRKARPYLRIAQRLRVDARVRWLGHRDDIPETMAIADVLVHPARLEVAGQVILEAVANGLPVIASEICGYAHHVRSAGAGKIVAEPFDEEEFRAALTCASDPATRLAWSASALGYSRHRNFARGLEVAAEIIEAARRTGEGRRAG